MSSYQYRVNVSDKGSSWDILFNFLSKRCELQAGIQLAKTPVSSETIISSSDRSPRGLSLSKSVPATGPACQGPARSSAV